MGLGLQICKYLVSRGFDVTIASDQRWTPSIKAIGAHVSPLVVRVVFGKKKIKIFLNDRLTTDSESFGEPLLMMRVSGDE